MNRAVEMIIRAYEEEYGPLRPPVKVSFKSMEPQIDEPVIEVASYREPPRIVKPAREPKPSGVWLERVRRAFRRLRFW